MSETLPALPLDWIKRIFARMEAVYGSAMMAGIWGVDADKMNNAFQVWADELRNFGPTPDAIKYALEHLPGDYPPNLLQFREICRDGLKTIPKPVAIEHKITTEQMAKNRDRIAAMASMLKKSVR